MQNSQKNTPIVEKHQTVDDEQFGRQKIVDIEKLRTKYKDVKGKTNSMYVYILHSCSQEKLKEHVKKQLDTLDRVNDSFKRRLYASRYHLIREMIEQNSEGHIYNCVMLISDELDLHHLTNENKKILKRFEHPEISFTYGDVFDLDYVYDMLFNDVPYHMFRVNNNRIEYIHLTKTKKVVVGQRESKPLDVLGYINEVLPSNARYILYGVSSKLKDITDPRAYTVIPKHVKDEELITMIERIDQEELLSELVEDLTMMLDIKQMHKIVFKKEIPGRIKNSQLQKLYIDTNSYSKFSENMKKASLEENFKVIKIDPTIKSFVENRERTLDQYEGFVGVCYY